jgi:3',5'-cyclic AMP phosphodiesterase CpdA
MLIAHISDLHVLALGGLTARHLFSKRITGYANLRLKRDRKHKTETLERTVAAVREAKPDHVIVTGDLTNLALDSEFAAVRELLDRGLGMSPKEVSVIPGNHDTYTRGSVRSLRFQSYFADYMTSDLPVALADGFPFVRLRGPVAVIGITSAVARAPLVAAGEVGPAQRQRILEVLAHPDVKKRYPLFLIHHPPYAPRSAQRTLMESLRDAPLFQGVLAHARSALVAHGHLHRRIRYDLGEQAGEIVSIGATSASLHHEDSERVAGVNIYEVDDKTCQLVSAYAHVAVGIETGASTGTATFERREIPFGVW